MVQLFPEISGTFRRGGGVNEKASQTEANMAVSSLNRVTECRGVGSEN